LVKLVKTSNTGEVQYRSQKRQDCKIEFEKCGPLSIVGIESIGNSGKGSGSSRGRSLFPCYESSCPAVYDSKVLQISVPELKKIIQSMHVFNAKSSGSPNQSSTTLVDPVVETARPDITALKNTLSLLSAHHDRRLAWWELRKQFHRVYFDVNVSLTIVSAFILYTLCFHLVVLLYLTLLL